MRSIKARMVMAGLVVAVLIVMYVDAVSYPISHREVSTATDKNPWSESGVGNTPKAISVTSAESEETVTLSTDRQLTSSTRATDESIISPVGAVVRNAPGEVKPADSSRFTTSIISSENGPALGTNFDAGGPYGGSSCLEGSCFIHFEVTTDDPTIIFYRWDFNNDGVWDTAWSTDNFVDKVMYDNYYGDVKAEGWDGISTRNVILMGTNLGETTLVQWYLNSANAGWKFNVKETITATHLGYWLYITQYPGLSLRIWDFASRVLLGSCTPLTQLSQKWNWCSLSAPITLRVGSEYMVSFHKYDDNSPYFTGVTNQDLPWDKVEFEGFYYAFGMPMRFPDVQGVDNVVPKVDFRWRQIKSEPWARQDKASLDVRNVSPSTSDVTFDQVPAKEGTEVQVTAKFDDPGLDDTWHYRWTFDNNTWTEWQEVRKSDGGAKVLIYHSMTDYIVKFKDALKTYCGTFCIAVDDYDFGSLGANKNLPLEELMKYDVIYVETNWPIPDQEQAGDLLADYMDQKGLEGSGGVVMGNGPFIVSSQWDIRGRFFRGGYTPVEKDRNTFGDWNLGVIYTPGHPIMDGVSTLTSYMHIDATKLTTGASRIADWSSGRIAVATKLDPYISNGARSVALPWSAWFECKGDCIQVTVNAIRWASRQHDPIPLSMPIQLPWTRHLYNDDDPVTTSPSDNFTARLEVKDDDHSTLAGRIEVLYSQNFGDCAGGVFPPGWVNTPSDGWRCGYSDELSSMAATIWYYNNGYNTSLLDSPEFDLSTFTGGSLQWRQYWRADYPGSTQDGYVEASLDGGTTFSLTLAEFHHSMPALETAKYSADFLNVSSGMKFRFRFENNDDWGWSVDDVRILGTKGYVIWGLGNGTSTLSVENMPVAITGGPASDTARVGITYNFTSLRLSDPALYEGTEWFAYQFDFGDGMPTQWIYRGSLVPPRLDILIIHSLCTTGNSCTDYMNMVNMIQTLDVYGSVTGYNFFAQLSAPSLNYMMNFDVIMFASDFGYIGYPPFDMARTVIGNNIASYLDNHGGGVITWLMAFDLSPYYGDAFSLRGRYIDQDYGPFEQGYYDTGVVFFPPTIDVPDHPVMAGLNKSKADLVESGPIHSGDLAVTPDGLRLASWYDGHAAVGVKDFNNDGRRSCAIGAFAGSYAGSGAPTLLRNCLGWVIGGFPSPDLPTTSHTWGSVGTFTVDISSIDDDMGWTWDSANSVPAADPRYAQTVSHRYIQIEVIN